VSADYALLSQHHFFVATKLFDNQSHKSDAVKPGPGSVPAALLSDSQWQHGLHVLTVGVAACKQKPRGPTRVNPKVCVAPPCRHDMAATSKVPLDEYAQCGGEGGVCAIIGSCRDAPVTTRQCVTGTTCQRQSNWYWQVRETA
jgi:hypothetical protein